MKKLKITQLLLLFAVAILAMGCSKESEEPNMSMGEYGQALAGEGDNQIAPGGAEDSGITPFGQTTVLMHNYALNVEQVFFTFPSVDPFYPTESDVLGYMYGGVVGIPLIGTQMALPDISWKGSLYSCYDAEYPVILISALGGKMKVRCMAPSIEVSSMKTLFYGLRLPDDDGGFRAATPVEQEFFGYAYEEVSDWQTLDFPENHSGDFRVVCMSIGREYEFNGTLQNGYSRTWFFVQLPWTDDEEVFDRVPLYSMDDLAK